MSSNYLNMIRGQRRRQSAGFQFTSKNLLAILALVGMGASAVYWWGVQSQLTDNRVVALAYTAILVLAPPSLVSFLIPWSPGGMLLQKVNARTWGYAAVICASLYLIYYSYQLQTSWWSAQPVVRDSNLVYQQVLIGIIGFIIIPALLWTPVTSEELVEQVRQAHLVKRYELQTQADIAILRSTLLRAQEQALVGFANLTVDEREELAGVMRGLVEGIDRTLREVGESVHRVSGAMVPFEALADNDDVQEILDYIGGSLVAGNMRAIEAEPDRSVESAPARPRQVEARSVELVPIARHNDSGAGPVVTVGDMASTPLAATRQTTVERRMSPVATGDMTPRSVGQDRTVSDDRRDDDTVLLVKRKLSPGWTSKELADLLRRDQRTAQRRIERWIERGWIKKIEDGRYDVTITEVR